MTALPVPTQERGAGSGPLRDPSGAIAPERTAPRSSHPLVMSCIRPAMLADVPALERLIEPFVATGDLLPRSSYDLCRHIKEYVVVPDPDGDVVACGSLKIYSQELAEIAAIAVRDDRQGRGLGRVVVEALVAEARRLGLAEVFGLTRRPAFFFRLGFAPADKGHFPLKVWADCARCPRRDCCDEVAVSLRLDA